MGRGGGGEVPQRVRLHVLWNPTSDTLNKTYLEERFYTGDDSSRSPSEKNHQTERQDNRKETGLRSMQAEDLHAVTGLVNCAFLLVGGQWFSKTSLRKTPVHEDGGHDHDVPLVHVVLCSSGFNCSPGIFRSWTV